MASRKGRDPGREISRRDFLRLGWSEGLTRGVEAVERTFGEARKTPAAASRLGSLYELRTLPVGAVRSGPRGSRLYLVRLPEGLLALSARCPQDGHLVTWRSEDASEDALGPRGRFYCAGDASIFDRRGRLAVGPAPRGLDVVPLELRDGALWADPAATVAASAGDQETTVFRLGTDIE